MHHFIYPSQDTYITNRPHELDTKNFGVDEILQVGTDNSRVKIISPTKDYTYVNEIFTHVGVQNFNGTFTGSITGTNVSSSATVYPYGGETVTFTGSFQIDNFQGSVDSGSLICLYGTASGVDTRQENSRVYVNQSFADRALLQFDLTAISQSIVNGDIANPSFYLKVKVSKAYQLPIEYQIYAFPISESWGKGNGYASDGGSDSGASWVYRDYSGGVEWTTAGGTCINSPCTQSFSYTTGDIDMDVTPIVNSWLNGAFPNNGLCIMSSDELQPTGSGFILKYFSQDTNTIYSPVLDVAWDDSVFVTGSISTGSVVIGYSSSSHTTIAPSSSLTGAGGIHGNFKASAFINISSVSESFASWNGFISGSGFTGNINGVPVYGTASGLINTQSVTVTLPNEMRYSTATSPFESPYASSPVPYTNSPYTYVDLEYVWGGDGVGWSSLLPIPDNATVSSSCGVSHSVQLMSGEFSGGPFDGCTFTAYYENYCIRFADLTGSWSDAALVGTSVIIPLPQTTYPYVTAHLNGLYINGTALGLYTVYDATSASFNGQIVKGPLKGGYCSFQLTGSAETASYAYTSSVDFVSSSFEPMETGRPFSINLQNLQPEYKVGDIIKLNVFGRKKFPLKDFGISTQQRQYLVPEFLPFESYWALKDNQTDEIVVNFDSYTRISCQYPEGNYFFVDTTGLPQERYYRVLIRIDDGQQITTVDTGKTFKITR